MRSAIAFRKRKLDAQAAQRAGARAKRTAMRLDDGARDRKAEPRAAARPVARAFHPEQALGQPPQVFLGYAGRAVLPDHAAIALDAYGNHARRIGVAQAVLQQVAEDLRKAAFIPADHDIRGSGKLEL